jgi:hypothetical protein
MMDEPIRASLMVVGEGEDREGEGGETMTIEELAELVAEYRRLERRYVWLKGGSSSKEAAAMEALRESRSRVDAAIELVLRRPFKVAVGWSHGANGN